MKQALMAGAAAFALLLSAPPLARAELLASANDNKATLVNGATVIARDPAPDSVTVFDLAATPLRVVAQVAVPASVVGPPFSVALTPDERLVIVTSNQKIDPANPARTIPDNRLSVIDLSATPPAVVQTLETGLGPAGLSVNRAGTMALVANREEGTVSIFRIHQGRLEGLGKVEVAAASAGVSHVAFLPDGRHALVTRDGDFFVTVLAIEGETVTRTPRNISAGLRPYGLSIAHDGSFAAVANIGRGGGDADTISLISLSGPPATWRVVETVSVGQTPEGIQLSPDGRLVAATVMNGSNKPEGSPFRGPGLLRIWRVENMRLVPAGQAEIGPWSQGVVFSADSRRVLSQGMVDHDIRVFDVAADGALGAAGPAISLPGGGAALRIADR